MADLPSDLFRIDEDGGIQAASRGASQKMRTRRGTFRLMPGPPHIVFMRYVGEDGKRDEQDGAVVRLSGEIVTRGSLCDIVNLVGSAGWRGELIVLDGVDSRSVFFEGGCVIGAHSNAEGERLGEILYQLGALTEQQVAECMAVEGKRLGDAAVSLGLLTRDHLYELMRQQAEEIVYKTLLIGDGMFYFLDRFDEGRLPSRHDIPATHLLMEGVRRMDEMSYFRERIPTDEHVAVRTDGKKEPPSESLRAIWANIDGVRNVIDLGRVSEKSNFDVTQALFQLCQSGHVQIKPPRPSDPVRIVETFNQAMSMLFVEVEAESRGEELRAQLSAFASSSGMYVALFMFAGPAPDGTFDRDRVVANISNVGVDDRITAASQWLYDYAAFAIFAASSLVSVERSREMSRRVGEVVSPLRQTRAIAALRHDPGPLLADTREITDGEFGEDEISFDI